MPGLIDRELDCRINMELGAQSLGDDTFELVAGHKRETD
jgi:hypothetical protein